MTQRIPSTARGMRSLLQAALLLTAAGSLSAQVETLPETEINRWEARLPELKKNLTGPARDFLDHLSPDNRTARISGIRAAQDAKDTKFDGAVLHYAVPALSDAQYLPDAYPYNGHANAPMRILAARGEYEPGSFLLFPFQNSGRTEIKLSQLKTADGRIFPEKQLDLRVVKVWYQDKNAWYSYFGDQGMKLVPELLLHDEELVSVDTKTQNNYARLTEKDGKVSFRCISLPLKLDTAILEDPRRGSSAPTFRSMAENFRDADTLRTVTLNAGEFKQFLLTVHVPADAAPGLYRGTVRAEKDGRLLASVPVELRVLPFLLPKPKTYQDVTRDFLVSSYSYFHYAAFLTMNGGDYDLAVRQLKSVLKNLAAHNQDIYWLRGDFYSRELKDQFEAMKEAGMRTDIILAGNASNGPDYKMNHEIAMAKKYALATAGHTNFYLGWGDEPQGQWLMDQRHIFRAYQQEGFKFLIAGWDAVFHKAGYLYDWANIAGSPEAGAGLVRNWNNIGHANVAWYAGHHEGVENPSFNRRQNGLAPYLNNFSALCNYAHHLGPWNDRSHTYRNMTITYGAYDGIIDTLAWEGFREGIDDIRYATLMKTLALEAEKSSSIDTVYAGRCALYFLASLNPVAADQDAARLEMIRHILNLRSLLGKEN